MKNCSNYGIHLFNRKGNVPFYYYSRIKYSSSSVRTGLTRRLPGPSIPPEVTTLIIYLSSSERIGLLGCSVGPIVFTEMNVNSFGRVMAYLTLVYIMEIPEGAKREAVRLAAVILRDVDISRVEQSILRRIERMLSNMFVM